MRDPTAPPIKRVQTEIQQAARQLERLRAQRRVILKRLRAKEDEIRSAGHLLTGLVRDATTEQIVTSIVGATPDGSDVP